MPKTLPPRLRIFFRQTAYSIGGYFAALGVITVIGEGIGKSWLPITGLVIGSAIAAFTRDLPDESDTARDRREPSALER